MHAVYEPAFSMNVTSTSESDSFAKVQDQLTAFGLNPHDWRSLGAAPAELPRLVRARFILVHRDDEDLRLRVNIQSDLGFAPSIRDIEMLVV